MDEEVKAAEDAVNASQANQTGETTPEQVTPPDKQTPEEVSESPAKAEDLEPEEGKKGFQSRIKELDTKAKTAEQRAVEAEQRAQSLSEKLEALTGTATTPDAPTLPSYKEGETVSPERLSADVAKTAQAVVELQIKQNNAINRINNESRDVVRKYPQLDPDSDTFDSELSESITEATEAYVRNAPFTASVEKFVDKLMKPYKRSVDTQVGQVTEKIAKQVSETALRPTSIRKQEKPAAEKSMTELEQELGIVNS